MKKETVTVMGVSLDVEFDYFPEPSGSLCAEPEAAEVKVHKVRYKRIDVSELLDSYYTLKIEKAVIESLKALELEELLETRVRYVEAYEHEYEQSLLHG